MTRLSAKTIAPLLDEFARLKAKCISIELKRDAELQPLKDAYEKKAGPIVEAAQVRLTRIQQRMQILAGDIDAQLMSGVDEVAETVDLFEVVVEIETTKSVASAVAKLNGKGEADLHTNEDGKPVVTATASVDVKPGNRVIDPEALFKAVKPSERVGRFWTMFKVMMGQVDKVLGKDRAESLASTPKSYSTSISFKS